mgnify:CR=1 FL=1
MKLGQIVIWAAYFKAFHATPILTLFSQPKTQKPSRGGLLFEEGCLAVTYFRTGNPHYHRREPVSRSCSGWEGVGPSCYGRQA